MTVNFRSGYLPPGIYVEEDNSAPVTSIGLGATVLCLIGSGLGYNIYTETISFAGGNSVPLTRQGVDPSSIVVTGQIVVSGTPIQVTFTLDDVSTPHDYSVSQSGSGNTATTTLTRTTSGRIPSGGSALVTYHYTDPSYFNLNRFSDSAGFEDAYGAPFDPITGDVQSPLSLAARMAFQNGANLVYAVALTSTGTTTDQFQAAYNKTLPNFDINLMVPLNPTVVDGSTASSLGSLLSNHLQTASDDGTPRVGLFGVAQAFSGETPDVLAGQLGTRRVVLVWPPALSFYNPQIQQTQTLDGYYAAAAAAGALADQNVNRGLTQLPINGFTGFPASVLNTLTTPNKNSWSQSGVAVFEVNRLNQLVIRHGVTTQVDSVQNRELSIVREGDAVLNMIQVALQQANLIGDPILTGNNGAVDTALSVKSIVAGALETAKNSQIIQDYTNLQVRQLAPPDDPTVIQVRFSWKPTFPLNYIDVLLSLDLSSGSVTTTTTDASS